MHFIILCSLLSCLASYGHASATLSSIQEISGFSDSCNSAYNTPVSECSHSTFSLFSSKPKCSSECADQLSSLGAAIQSACRGGSGVVPDTVIGHAFLGDMSDFLCGNGKFDGQGQQTISSGPATNALASTSSSAAASATDSTTTDSTSSTTSSSTTPSSTTTSTSSSTSSQSSTTVTTSATRASSSSSSSSSAAVPRTTSSRNSIGDSTPFDQTVPNSANSQNIGLQYWLSALGILVLAGM